MSGLADQRRRERFAEDPSARGDLAAYRKAQAALSDQATLALARASGRPPQSARLWAIFEGAKR